MARKDVRLMLETAGERPLAVLPGIAVRMDQLIAAHALSLGLTLVTNNEADFKDYPGLKVENWVG